MLSKLVRKSLVPLYGSLLQTLRFNITSAKTLSEKKRQVYQKQAGESKNVNSSIAMT